MDVPDKLVLLQQGKGCASYIVANSARAEQSLTRGRFKMVNRAP